MPHLQYDPVTKHLVHNRPAGAKHLVHTCEALAAAYRLDPCIDTVSTCNKCEDDLTPAFLTVTVDGVTPNVGNCRGNEAPDPPVSFKLISIACAVNGQFVLPRTGGCSWSKTVACNWEKHVWLNRTCAGATDFEWTYSEIIYRAVKESNTQWLVAIDGQSQGSGPQGPLLLFESRVTVPYQECLGNVSFENDQADNASVNIDARDGTWSQVAGDIVTPAVRCPGGESYYTNTDLSAYLGKRVLISEDPDICYAVNANSDQEMADGEATVTNCWTTCAKCCDEDPEDC